ncbi:hypothetical protein Dimus_026539 [Dionaea muscipula]
MFPVRHSPSAAAALPESGVHGLDVIDNDGYSVEDDHEQVTPSKRLVLPSSQPNNAPNSLPNVSNLTLEEQQQQQPSIFRFSYGFGGNNVGNNSSVKVEESTSCCQPSQMESLKIEQKALLEKIRQRNQTLRPNILFFDGNNVRNNSSLKVEELTSCCQPSQLESLKIEQEALLEKIRQRNQTLQPNIFFFRGNNVRNNSSLKVEELTSCCQPSQMESLKGVIGDAAAESAGERSGWDGSSGLLQH